MKGLEGGDCLQEMPAGQMCHYNVKLTDAREVDAELVSGRRKAYESAV